MAREAASENLGRPPEIDATFSKILENIRDWSRKDFKKPS